jgi:hypothetical protein
MERKQGSQQGVERAGTIADTNRRHFFVLFLGDYLSLHNFARRRALSSGPTTLRIMYLAGKAPNHEPPSR